MNLQSTIDSWDKDSFDAEGSNSIRARLMFLLACFHAVVQERRTYLPQGWTKFYEFSYGDMKAGTFVMEAMAESKGASRGEMDWEAIHGLMEDAIYGGRIDNAYDMRVLRAYLRLFFCSKLTSDRGVIDIIPGTALQMPATPDFATLKKVVSSLNDTDPPSLFCLPDNMERSLQRTTSSNVIKQLRALSAVDVAASKYDREKWRAQLGPILELWQQMSSSATGMVNRRISISSSSSAFTAATSGKDQSPLGSFVDMEYELAGDLCAVVDSTLTALKKVLFGTGLLTPAIQAAAMFLLSDSVPAEWTKRWENGPEKPQKWLRELVRKRVALGKWQQAVNRKTLLTGDPLELSDLFHPITFINALRQQTAREIGVAIDRVKMICSWEKDGSHDVKRSCPLPCTLQGLQMQGANFKSGRLQEPPSDAAEMFPTPPVSIGFVAESAQSPYSKNESLAVPVYLSSSREELLMELDMPSGDGDHNKWIPSGVALFLSDDDA